MFISNVTNVKYDYNPSYLHITEYYYMRILTRYTFLDYLWCKKNTENLIFSSNVPLTKKNHFSKINL